MIRLLGVGVLLIAFAACGGCQSYGSRPYDVTLNSSIPSAKLYLVPNSDWVGHEEASVFDPRRRAWLDQFELKQQNRPVETKLLGYEHVFVVINPSAPTQVYTKKFNPMRAEQRDIALPAPAAGAGVTPPAAAPVAPPKAVRSP